MKQFEEYNPSKRDNYFCDHEIFEGNIREDISITLEFLVPILNDVTIRVER